MGRVLWQMERDHPTYGAESAQVCINEADELLLVVGDSNDEAAATMTDEDVQGLHDVLALYLKAKTL